MQTLRCSFPLAVLSLFATGCSSDISTEIGFSESTLRVGFKYVDSETVMNLDWHGAAPSSGAVEVRFMGADGKPTGSWQGTPPVTAYSVPPNSVRWQLVAGPPATYNGLNDSGVITFAAPWLLMGGAVLFDPLASETQYATTFQARSRAEAQALLEQVLVGFTSPGPSALPQGLYRIHELIHTRVAGASLEVTLGGQTPFEEFEFVLNDVPLHAMDDSEFTHENGVHRAKLRVPMSEFDHGAGSGSTASDTIDLRYRNAGQRTVQASARWESTML